MLTIVRGTWYVGLMGSKTEYMRLYMKRRYDERRAMAIEFLGGKCVVCGTKERLEIDHVDPKKKKYKVDQTRALSEKNFWKEIKKCQLLCHVHHVEKTLRDKGQTSARGRHGTLSTYRYCKCDLCRAANNVWNRDYKRARRAKLSAG